MSGQRSWHFVVPMSAEQFKVLGQMSTAVGLKPANLAVLMMLRSLNRGGLQGVKVPAPAVEEQTVVVSLPDKQDHDAIIKHARELSEALGRKVAAKQIAAILLRDEINKKWFINNFLGGSSESRGTLKGLEKSAPDDKLERND